MKYLHKDTKNKPSFQESTPLNTHQQEKEKVHQESQDMSDRSSENHWSS